MAKPFSSLCISLLTELLDLNSLEGLLDEQRESYVLKNIRTELGDDAARLEADIPVEDAAANINENGEKKEKKFHIRLIKSNSKENNNVFGGRLNENSVQIVIKIMEHLKDYTDVEGLFRISGNKRRQEDLKEMLNKGHFVDLTEKTYSQHDLTTILKQFFAELSEPLLTDSLYSCYKQVAGKTREMDGKVSTKKRLTALQLLSLLLPPLNRLLFKKLIELLHLVSKKTVNLMTPKNLAVVFAPNIAAKTKISCLTDYSDNLEPLTDIIEFIIENAQQVFKVPDDLFDSKQKCKTGTRVLGTPKSYCRRFDPRNYQQETVKTTNDALAQLYTQVMNMPDNHPMKKQFLDDFKRKYPGTPPFVPKCRRGGTESPVVNKTPLGGKRKMDGNYSNLSADFDKHDDMFLSTPEKRRLFAEGELAEHNTPDPLDFDSEQASNDNVHRFDTIPEKRRRFRRPSFSRPSFGFFSKRSTPDLRKLSTTPSIPTNSTNKRSRSNSANDDNDPKRRFSFTPFLDRKFNQRPATERRPSKRSNKVSSKIVKNMNFEAKDSLESNDKQGELFQLSNMTIQSGKKPEARMSRLKPELRAPLMKIQSNGNGKSLLPSSMSIRRETLALHKEQRNTIDAFRPRRETLGIHRDNQPAIIPFKPRREHFDYEKGQPILESFKPKRDSLLIHKKCQPQIEQMKSVTKDVYEDSEFTSNGQRFAEQKAVKIEKENHAVKKSSLHRPDRQLRLVDRDVNSPIKFTTFGKTNIEVNQQFELMEKNKSHVRRMSTGSIRRSEWTPLKTYEDGCLVTFL